MIRCFFLCLSLCCSASFAWAGPLLEVHFIDVGQGDGILLRTPTGKTVLIDVGPPSHRHSTTKYLKGLGIQKINLLLITHPHLDHYGGYRPVLRHFKIGAYIDPGFPYPFPKYNKMIRAIKRKGIRRLTGRLGQTLDLGGGTKLWLLAPQMPFVSDSRSDANANSIVALLEYKNLRVLLTGDAEAETEERLLHYKRLLRANVLKVAHHGSKHATSDTFLKAVKPRIAVISCAKKNRYHHPHPKTMARLRRKSIRTYVTARHGSVILRSDGQKVWMSTRGQSRKRAVQTFTLRRRPKLSLQRFRHLLSRGYAEHRSAPESKTVSKRLGLQHEKHEWINVKRKGRHVIAKTHRPSKGGYVASRRSKVFHRHSCRFARRIPKRSRVRFRTRRAALRSGRRPAKGCRP